MISQLKNYSLPLLILICLGSIIFTFNAPLQYLHNLWLNNNNGYSHGYLVLAISIYLLFLNRDKFAQIKPRPSAICFILFLGNLVCYSVADYLSIAAIQIPLLIPLVWFTIGTIAGTKALKFTAFPILFLFFAAPIWDILLPLLQSITVYISKFSLRILDITAFYHGDTVTLPYGDVVIEESCSGLRYLTISLTLSALYYYLNFRSHPLRGSVMIGTAILLALLSNWIRVTYIIYIAYISKMQDPLVADHYNFGWILYSFSLIPFFFIARQLQPIEAQGESPPRADNKNILSVKASSLTAITCAIIIVVLPHYSNQFKLEPAKQLIYAPQPALHWQSSAAYLSPSQWQATFYGYDYKEHVNYTKADSKTAVRLDIYGYKQQDQGKELISDTHFVASRLFWRVTLPSPIVVNGIKIQPQVVHDKTGKRLVWHWYNVAGLSTSNKRFAKIYELVNFTLAEKQASAVILISSTCRSNCLKASERLTAATSELNLLNL